MAKREYLVLSILCPELTQHFYEDINKYFLSFLSLPALIVLKSALLPKKDKNFELEIPGGASLLNFSALHGCLYTLKLSMDEKWSRTDTPDDVTTENACKNGHLHVLKFLIERKCRVSIYALMRAAVNNHFEVVEFLVKRDKNHSFTRDASVVAMAAGQGHLKIVKFLANNNFPIIEDALIWASAGGHFKIVKFFVKNGLSACSSATTVASENGHLEIVKFFIENEFEFKEKALILASAKGHYEIVKLLVENGCPVKKEALLEASRNGRFEIFDFLIKSKTVTEHDVPLRFIEHVKTQNEDLRQQVKKLKQENQNLKESFDSQLFPISLLNKDVVSVIYKMSREPCIDAFPPCLIERLKKSYNTSFSIIETSPSVQLCYEICFHCKKKYVTCLGRIPWKYGNRIPAGESAECRNCCASGNHPCTSNKCRNEHGDGMCHACHEKVCPLENRPEKYEEKKRFL